MEQWKIISEIYKLVNNKILGKKYPNVEMSVIVKDICQCMQDRTGQKIIVNEHQYELPAVYVMGIAIQFQSKDIEALLQAYGEIAVIIKDNPELNISSYEWHKCTSSKIYLEPVIRKLNFDKDSNIDGVCKLELLYSIEFSLNSQKTYEFKRVEKREIHSVHIN